VSQETFDKEGTVPVFVLRVTDDAGKIVERKYKLNTPIVRRVLAPGEPSPKPAPRRKHRRGKSAGKASPGAPASPLLHG
jgi:hypothetical protein